MERVKVSWLAAAIVIIAGLWGVDLVGVSVATARTLPPTLNGETLSAGPDHQGIGCINSPGGPFSANISGTASGPYAGTFTETLRGNVNPTRFVAVFTIDAPNGKVIGVKNLTSGPAGCYIGSNSFTFSAQANYQALIHTPQGNYTDQGTASTSLLELNGSIIDFSEVFTSSHT